MNLEELKAAVEAFGKPKKLTVGEVRLAIDDYVTTHKNEKTIIGDSDIELALAYGVEPEEILELDLQVYKSLIEQYQGDTQSLKQLIVLDALSRRVATIGSSKSKDLVKEPPKSEST